MKRNLITLFLMIAIGALRGYAQIDNAFVSKDGRFSVTPPLGFENLKYEKATRTTESGDIEMSQYSLEISRGTCLIAYYDFPEIIFQTKSVDRIYSDSVAELLRNGDKTISNQQNITVEGLPAISFDLRIPNGKLVRYTHTVLVVAKPRMYSLMFLSADQVQLNKPDVLTFFKSFHIPNR